MYQTNNQSQPSSDSTYFSLHTMYTLPSSEDDMTAVTLLFLNYTVIKNMTLPLRLGISVNNIVKKHPHFGKACDDDLSLI